MCVCVCVSECAGWLTWDLIFFFLEGEVGGRVADDGFSGAEKVEMQH